MPEFVLASASPRRKELLGYLIKEFTVSPTDSDESLPEGIKAEKAVELLSKRKAEACAKKHPHAVVIGCDTVVELDGQILGKPSNELDARRMLSMLSGKMCIRDRHRSAFHDGRHGLRKADLLF